MDNNRCISSSKHTRSTSEVLLGKVDFQQHRINSLKIYNGSKAAPQLAQSSRQSESTLLSKRKQSQLCQHKRNPIHLAIASFFPKFKPSQHRFILLERNIKSVRNTRNNSKIR